MRTRGGVAKRMALDTASIYVNDPGPQGYPPRPGWLPRDGTPYRRVQWADETTSDPTALAEWEGDREGRKVGGYDSLPGSGPLLAAPPLRAPCRGEGPPPAPAAPLIGGNKAVSEGCHLLQDFRLIHAWNISDFGVYLRKLQRCGEPLWEVAVGHSPKLFLRR